MSIPAEAKGTPLPRVDGTAPFTEQSGVLSNHGIQTLSTVRDFIVGMNRVTPCSASGSNVITLTPNDASPLIEKYVDYEIYAFRAEATSTGSVTATVVPKKGTLATLKVYKSPGTAQAGAGDVVADGVYLAIYADHLDSGVGGFVLK